MSASKWKPFPEYKSSNIDWIGEIPKGWQTKKVKLLFQLSNEPSRINHGKELLSIYTAIGVRPRKNLEQKGNKATSTDGYWVVKKDDLIVNKLLAWMGAIGRSEYDGVTSPAYDILRPLPDTISEYYHFLFRCGVCLPEFKKHSRGIMDMRLRLYFEELGSIEVFHPPPDEQKKIAHYCAVISKRIDNSIIKIESLVKLIKEKCCALVDMALRNPDTKEMRLIYAVDKISRPVERDQTETYHSLGLYNRGRGIFHKPPKIGAELGDSDFYYVEADDLILSGQFAWEGAVALAEQQHSGCVVSHRYPILRGKTHVLDSAYLQAFFNTEYGDFILNQHSVGAAGRNRPLNLGSLLKEKIPIPPLEKQLEISRLIYLQRDMKTIFEKYSTTLENYRSALISAAVTGKIDIRESV